MRAFPRRDSGVVMGVTRREFAAFLGALALTRPRVAVAADPAQRPGAGTAVLDAPEQIWVDLVEGNKRFIAGQHQAPRDLQAARERLAKGQAPKVIVLGCSDSRVSPDTVFDKSIGQLFVVRTAGNIADAIALGSMEYAVEHLHSRLLVVLGHENCGAVVAAASGQKMPSRNLEAIVQKIRPAIDKVGGGTSGAASGTPDPQHLGRLVEANIRQSAQDVLKNSEILRHHVEQKKLAVVLAMYGLRTGQVTRLS
jgi:carbonic anhydrase